MLYDVCMLVIVGFTTIRGAMKGMAWQVAAIAALLLCFAFAAPASLAVAPVLPLDAPLNRWVAMLGIYLVFSFVCFAVARAWRNWLEAQKFEEYDKHLGALFGLVKGAVLCLVVTFFTVCLLPSARASVLLSHSGHYAGVALDHLALVMPAELGAMLAPYLQRFDDAQLAVRGETPRAADEIEPDSTEFRGSTRSPFTDDGETLLGSSSQRRDRPSSNGDDVLNDVLDTAADALHDRFRTGVSQFVKDSLLHDGERRTSVQSYDAEDARDSAEAQSAKSASVASALAEIARLLAPSDQEQQSQREALEALLRGFPAAVSTRALEDWQADLRGNSRDPDTVTDLTTPLDVRLLRQLQQGGVDIESLSGEIRQRMQSAQGQE